MISGLMKTMGRLLVMDVSEDRSRPMVFINPEIIESEGGQVYEEGCLSVPGIYANVERAETIKVRAFQPDGTEFEQKLDGLDSVCLQHEMDHLEGILFVDHLSALRRGMILRKLTKAKRGDKPLAKYATA